MTFFTSGFFWFIQGILITVIILAFRVWMEDKGVKMVWWKWLMFGIWIILAGFTIAFIFTSLGEGEPTAAVKGGIIFSLITITSGVGIWRLINKKR
ncbi:MAG: dehalogenase [Candidatus Aminicenantes bacterium]|nr:dehalogenase [Candidatus Aminicenantes bacterium]